LFSPELLNGMSTVAIRIHERAERPDDPSLLGRRRGRRRCDVSHGIIVEVLQRFVQGSAVLVGFCDC
jgi:hypothetical protein